MRILLFVVLVLLPGSSALAETMKLEGVVNINTASPEELRLIPSVGPARIRNILAYRRAHPFRTVDELARIKGIGRKTVRRWRQHLAVSGPSTAERVLRPEVPFVGPPQAGPPAPTQPKVAATVPRQINRQRPGRPQPRRGEPAHGAAARAVGNHCLPPP